MITTTALLFCISVYFIAAYARLRKTVHKLEDQANSNQNIINQFQEAYTICAQRAIQHRLTLMQIDSPQLRSSRRLTQSIADLKQRFESKQLDPVTYYNKVNTTLDLVSTKNYN